MISKREYRTYAAEALRRYRENKRLGYNGAAETALNNYKFHKAIADRICDKH